jgi:hypothetical protein
VGWRLAAAWALLGFSSQCLLAVILGLDLVTGLTKAMIHYFAWGLAGWIAGSLVERIVEDSFRSRYFQLHTDEGASAPPGTQRSR